MIRSITELSSAIDRGSRCPAREMFGLALLGALALVHSTSIVLAHPDKIEDRLLVHFATGVHVPTNGSWLDLTHQLSATLRGEPVITNIGPASAVVFDGYHDWLELAGGVEAARAFLPTNEFSAAAWVLLEETVADGGIVGFVQDNGSYEKGWVLGYNRNTFSFGLATEGTDDGDGRLVMLRGKTPIARGQWHHVVGTYDGRRMRLFVNGQLDGESVDASGPIQYPDQGRYAAAAFADDNELHPLEGALYEVKVYARAMSAEEIAGVVAQNRGLVDYRSALNQNLQFVVHPYLQRATRDEMTIMCETTQPSRMTVEYDVQPPLKRRAHSAAAAAINEVRLQGLEPATTYFYRVTCEDADGNRARSDVFSFQTALPETAAWAFGILGDTQRNPEVTRRCAEGIFALRPNFMLHCGDVVDDGFAKHQWVNDLFEPCARLFAYVPVFPVIGNHERNAHWYYDYFSLPAPEYRYSFRYGNAEFFMIDSNKDCSPGSEQYLWLESALARSAATWKFTCHHHPCFSSDENDYGDHWSGKAPEGFNWGDSNVRQLVPLYERYGVDVAFAGHIHSYERTWPLFQMSINQRKGVRYIVSGGGGGGLEQAAPQRAWFTLHVQRGHHYCFATVHDRTIQFKAYDIEGRLFDTFELTKPVDR
jgi:hypothetical protein